MLPTLKLPSIILLNVKLIWPLFKLALISSNTAFALSPIMAAFGDETLKSVYHKLTSSDASPCRA